MTLKNAKTALFAVLIVAMILPFSMANYATAQDTKTAVINKAEEPTEFVGTLSAETRQIGSYLLVKHTYTSDELNLKNVDYVYREEIVPIDASITQQEIDDVTNNPEVILSHEMTIVHEDELTKIDKIQNGLDIISAQTYQQWNIVEMPNDTNPTTNPVSYYGSSITPVSITPVEDWASTKNSRVYVPHDPINLIWTDTQLAKYGKLITKIDNKMKTSGWDDWCIGGDLYVNISGKWMKQDGDYRDKTGSKNCNQYHVRAWSVNDNLVLGSAHKEILITKFPWEKVNIKHVKSGIATWEYDVPSDAILIYHFLTGFDTAEDEASGEFSGGCWSITKDSANLNNMYTREYYKGTTKQTTAFNDGFATEILCS